MPRSRSSLNASAATAHDEPMLATRLISAGILAPIVVASALLGEPWTSSLVGLLVFLAMVELISLLDAAGSHRHRSSRWPPASWWRGALIAANQALVGGALADLLRRLTRPASCRRPGGGASCCSAWPASPAPSRATDSSPGRSPRSASPTWHSSRRSSWWSPTWRPPAARHNAHRRAEPACGHRLDAPLLLVVWGYDSGAYLTGRWLGRRRLIDHISPSKTIEGLAGGLVAATIAAGIGTWLVGWRRGTRW